MFSKNIKKVMVMQRIIEKIVINVAPDKVWNFLTRLDQGNNYKLWHPTDHKKIIRISGNGQEVGTKYYIEEQIGTFLLRLPYELKQSDKSEYLEYAAWFPLSLFHSGNGSFTFNKLHSDQTEVIATVTYGYNIPLVGSLLDRLAEMIIKKDALAKHMKEEGVNLKSILENS